MKYTAFRQEKTVIKFVSLIVVFVVSSFSLNAQAEEAKKNATRMPAGVSDSQKNLEIRGQSRNLSMLLVLKNRHENIDFVKPRDSYRDEIQKTGF